MPNTAGEVLQHGVDARRRGSRAWRSTGVWFVARASPALRLARARSRRDGLRCAAASRLRFRTNGVPSQPPKAPAVTAATSGALAPLPSARCVSSAVIEPASGWKAGLKLHCRRPAGRDSRTSPSHARAPPRGRRRAQTAKSCRGGRRWQAARARHSWPRIPSAGRREQATSPARSSSRRPRTARALRCAAPARRAGCRDLRCSARIRSRRRPSLRPRSSPRRSRTRGSSTPAPPYNRWPRTTASTAAATTTAPRYHSGNWRPLYSSEVLNATTQPLATPQHSLFLTTPPRPNPQP